MRSSTGSQIIVNADDFGRSASVNAAVLQAYREGVLTSASLMVTGDAADEAVALAHKMPSLAVGLHLVVVDGRPALPPSRIPHLVNGKGQFRDDAVRAGVTYFFRRAAQEELAQEMEAQFNRFAGTGLELSHVDGHLHMHLHPTVLRLLLPLAVARGARGLRLPRDDLWLSLTHDRHGVGRKLAWGVALGLLARYGSRRIEAEPLVAPQRVHGLMQTGQMDEGYVLRTLDRLRAPSAELYFHPSIHLEGQEMGPNPGDLETLVSPAVRRTIEERGMTLATYATLRPA